MTRVKMRPVLVLAARVAPAVLSALLPALLQAQRNNGSDVTGLGITSSAPAGAVFVPATRLVPLPVAEGGTVSAPTSARFEQAVITLQQRLSAGAVQSLTGAPLSADLQRTLRGLFDPASRPAALDALRLGLAPMVPAGSSELAALLTSLADLGALATPRNVALAIDRFNAFVDAARPDALGTPGPAFTGLHAALMALGRDASLATR